MPQGRVIGINDSMELELVEFEIDAGDRIIAYTDGLVEAFNVHKEMFGLERLKSMLIESVNLTIDDAIEFIFRELQAWRASGRFDDDFTLIMIDIG
jgi:serine phosphatase RsbU (regulator of sigma subunit)